MKHWWLVGVSLWLSSFGSSWAHSGYDSLAWRQRAGPYLLSIFEDFHPGRTGRLLVQVSDGTRPAPASTRLSAAVVAEEKRLHTAFLERLADRPGQAYAVYSLEFPLAEAGLYGLELTVEGPLGAAERSYTLSAERGGVSPLEFLPSGLLLLVIISGAYLLFAPPAQHTRRSRAET